MTEKIISSLHSLNDWLQKAHLKNVMRITVSLGFFLVIYLVIDPTVAQKEGWHMLRIPLAVSFLYAFAIELLTRFLPPRETTFNDATLPTLGPFLCRATPQSMGFWMCFDHNVKNLKLEIFENNKHITTAIGKIIDTDFNTWLAETSTVLNPNTLYTYIVKVDEKEYLVSWKKDFKFKTQNLEKKEVSKIISMSCHGMDAWEKANGSAATWNMWTKVLNRVQTDDIDLCVLGGDQVYMDETFERLMRQYHTLDEKVRLRMIKKVYHQFWSHPAYQQTLAQTPSILMWDDHDLNDGFGSRSDSFKKNNELNENWTAYKTDLSRAFFAFQAVRNPGQNNPSDNYSFKLDTSNYSIVAFDLRSERNSRKKEMLSSASKLKVEKLFNEKDSPLFLLSPVTVTRINGKVEAIIGQLANAAWGSWKFLGHGPKFKKVLAWDALFALTFFALQMDTEKISFFLSACVLTLISISYLGKSFLDSTFDFKQLKKYLRGVLITGIIAGVIGVFIYHSGIRFENITAAVHTFIQKDIVNIAWFFSSMIVAQTLIFSAAGKEAKPNTITTVIKFFSASLTFIIFIWYGLAGVNFNLGVLFIKFPLWLCSLVILALSFAEAAHVIDELAGLDDDVKDSWSSETNENELHWLLKKISLMKRPIILLCGDIHTGGYSNIKLKNGKNIPQITSSPISYPPMANLVEKLTTGAKKASLPMTNPLAVAENVFFLSERNFAVIEIAKSGKLTTEFVFEDHDLPVKMITEAN